ncbi:MAG TPA: GNAT family N-acetyltransferase [Anaerolineales bacterium]|nr:GNAT family N-acetyltransferase [Anaerolineales bacterium]
MFSIRVANPNDIENLCALDAIAQQDERRKAFIGRSIGSGSGYVLEDEQQAAGYGVLEYSFYEQGFVSMLYISAAYRRQGAGLQLMQHLESQCKTAKLFTSTNLSNLGMQTLLAKMEYILSGVIHHLDENDPELVYVKYLKAGGQAADEKPPQHA